MTLADDAAQADDDASTATLRAKLDAERKAHAATRREVVKRDERVTELEQLLERYTVADPKSMTVPKWTAPRKTRKAHQRQCTRSMHRRARAWSSRRRRREKVCDERATQLPGHPAVSAG